ncbi:MAG: bifunctional UDP-3-O-[3-hydroxymyristoyl] N-acetylglucosamine deacetylase/3-hydroxyacyl-ACP dehydratase [Gemmatimonadaceae bacterium]|nr:bifunctional UDP-3-O-[3-hydroxymyristoyl] N-acetylglucosamine deacetylase/3-hydroxyacyl-ACP dehydratase [Gemmatimonadaceae bacterium]
MSTSGTRRRTVAGPATVTGIGLHLGQPVTLRFEPAPPSEGISFRRADRPAAPPIPALAAVATPAELRTQLGTGDAAFHTVEHVLAAVGALGIDDLRIVLDAAEPPVCDGSAAPFLAALQAAGLREHGAAARTLVLDAPVVFEDGVSRYEAHPADRFELDVTIDFPHPLIGTQRTRLVVTPESFERELASARTFGFLRDVEAMRARGLALGGTTENAVVLDETGVVGNALRFPDEFVRHKALDCVGDLVLAGARLRARVVAHKPSHRGTVLFVRELLRTAKEEHPVLGIEDIMRILPHRYPFLLVDRIVELQERTRVVGIKNVTINEPFFQGHFPGHPIMPGVLIVEAMAQVGGMLLLGSVEAPESKVVYFMSLDNVKFRKPVKPGDQLRFVLEVVQMRGAVCKMRGEAFVDGEVVCEADMAAMVRPK